MPWYNDLRPESDFSEKDYLQVFPGLSKEEKVRIIDNLLALKNGIENDVVPRSTDQNVLIASWNIKEFGHTTQRLPESYFYIAEILSRFDLIAIQEVKSTLKDFHIVMRLLGSNFDYILNDITEGTSGNHERSAYIFNTKRIQFGGLAGELNSWPSLIEGEGIQLDSLSRTPFITGFKAGWKKFAMVNMHLHPGNGYDPSLGEDVLRRKEEIKLLLAILKDKLDSENLWSEHLVLCGDFNFYPLLDDSTVQLIYDMGFIEVEPLHGVLTNVSETTAYDRFFILTGDYFKVGGGETNGGVFKFFDHVFKENSWADYVLQMQAVYGGVQDITDVVVQKDYFDHHWKRNQLSDHNLVWFELNVDSSVDFLESKRKDIVDSI